MAVGLPAKTTYADGDVFSASDINDTNGTLNLVGQTTNFYAGKNKIINGDFRVWQRGTSFSNPATSSYLADRFQINYDVAAPTTNTVTQESFTPGTAPVTGYESQYFLRSTLTTVGTNTGIKIQQRIEDVRTFANQEITFSFWAKADSSRTLSAISIVQSFGSGGSSAVATNFTTSTQAITTSWARYNFTVTVPSISGKTLGAGSYLMIRFTQPAAAGCVIDTWGWQVEAGSTATAFQTATGTIQGELAACQRYYYVHASGDAKSVANSAYYATNQVYGTLQFPVTMRVAPTAVFATGTDYYLNAANGTSDLLNSFTADRLSTTGTWIYNSTEALGTIGFAGIFRTSNASASLAFSAEL
jgi:hypothetical protein